jgi:hypothetical protein|tara:strand:- start:13029 stop:13628 length:600 start_codon:yes stop_codon:yes gene_type:complete
MTYFLGRDVGVILNTESNAYGLNVSAAGAVTAAAPGTAVGKRGAKTSIFSTSGMADVTSIDLGIGSMDEDISYMGQRTALKAEIKKETTVNLTLKKKDNKFDAIFAHPARWGVSGSSIANGMDQPTSEFGYRIYVQLKDTKEVFVVRNAEFKGHTVTLNPDSTQEETLEFKSMVQPQIFASGGASQMGNSTDSGGRDGF